MNAGKSALVKKKAKVASVFNMDSSEDEEQVDNGPITIEKLVGKTQKIEDFDEYDFDGTYTSYEDRKKQEEEMKRRMEGNTSSGSRYISLLKANANLRQEQKDRAHEKKILRNQEKEHDQYGDTEVFVSSAYREKLAAKNEWDYQETLTSKIEEINSVEKKGMASFYSNLYSKNVALGGDLKHSISSFTIGSEREKKLRTTKTENEDSPEKKQIDNDPHFSSRSDSPHRRKHGHEVRLSSSERKNHHRDSRDRSRDRRPRSRSRERRFDREERGSQDRSRYRDSDRDPHRDSHRPRGDSHITSKHTATLSRSPERTSESPKSVQVIQDTAARALSAKERYLERKKQQEAEAAKLAPNP